jgi:hypothetical protein
MDWESFPGLSEVTTLRKRDIVRIPVITTHSPAVGGGMACFRARSRHLVWLAKRLGMLIIRVIQLEDVNNE